MAEESSFDVDPALAASMGFSSFGQQFPTGKRKRNAKTDAVVDTDSAKQKTASGANRMELGSKSTIPLREEKKARHASDITAGAAATLKPAMRNESQSTSNGIRRYRTAHFPEGVKEKLDQMSEKELDALKRGVQNERGDMVYFLPSFLEDPWADCENDENGESKGDDSQEKKQNLPAVRGRR